jgi:copper chaperone CopZ
MSTSDVTFEVPDMTCSHCTNTIGGVLQDHGVTVFDIDLDTKKISADFPSAAVRESCYEAIRERGYTVVSSGDQTDSTGSPARRQLGLKAK